MKIDTIFLKSGVADPKRELDSDYRNRTYFKDRFDSSYDITRDECGYVGIHCVATGRTTLVGPSIVDFALLDEPALEPPKAPEPAPEPAKAKKKGGK